MLSFRGMKTVELDLNERQHVSLILGSQQVGPLDAMTLNNIFQKIKLSQTDELVIGLDVKDGTARWNMPSGLEPLNFDLEDEECRKLKAILNGWQGFTFRDAVWANALIRKLD